MSKLTPDAGAIVLKKKKADMKSVEAMFSRDGLGCSLWRPSPSSFEGPSVSVGPFFLPSGIPAPWERSRPSR